MPREYSTGGETTLLGIGKRGNRYVRRLLVHEGQILLADRAYDGDSLRRTLAERRAWANVKPMPNRKHILAFSQFLYRYRNLDERFFS